MKRFLITLLLVSLATSVAFGQVDESKIRFTTVQPAQTLVKTLRGMAGEINASVRVPAADPSGRIYYVDGNKSSAGNGSSWDDAYNTLSAAMAASHANIAVASRRAWATRNTIYVIADAILKT